VRCDVELYLEKTPARFGRSVIVEDSEKLFLVPQEEFPCKICGEVCLVGDGLYPGCFRMTQEGFGPPKITRCMFHRECYYQWRLNGATVQACKRCPTCETYLGDIC
jgi:hypothetical protein